MSELRFEAVGHRFGDRVVLADLDLVLTERRIGLIGANGSGKSTLARMINGLVVPTRGRVLVDDLDTARQAGAVRRKVGFVFTDPDAQIVMPTVAEDVAFSLRRSGLSRHERQERVEGTLQRFGLARLRDSPAHLLSGGEKQLLALASVIVTEPEVLVCDEPTTLLDARNSARVAAVLDSLPQQVVLVTHHLDLVSAMDRVLVVDEGRIAADASPEVALAAYREIVARP